MYMNGDYSLEGRGGNKLPAPPPNVALTCQMKELDLLCSSKCNNNRSRHFQECSQLTLLNLDTERPAMTTIDKLYEHAHAHGIIHDPLYHTIKCNAHLYHTWVDRRSGGGEVEVIVPLLL